MNKKICLISVLIVFVLFPMLLWGCGRVVHDTPTTTSSTTETSTTTGTETSTSTTTSSTTTTTDMTAPVINYVNPVNNAFDVATNTLVFAGFSKAMDPTSINTSTFLLSSSEAFITGAVTYDAENFIAIFLPSQNLASDTKYTASISAEVRDMVGNLLDSIAQWSFTTSATTDTTMPTVQSVSPASGETNVSIDSNISAVFSESMDSRSLNIYTMVVFETLSGIPKTGSVLYNSGANTAVFIPATRFALDTQYTVVISAEVKSMVGNQMAAEYRWDFTTVAVAPTTTTTSPTTTSTTSGGSTTTTTSGGSTTTTTSPTTSTTSGGSTTTTTSGGSTTTTTLIVAPTVLSTDPTAEATGVLKNASIFAFFSEPMDGSTINNSTFFLRKASSVVYGDVTYESSGNSLIFDPYVNLSASTTYTATITASVKNATGTTMATPYTWRFTTGTSSDTTPPTVEAVSPEAGATGVSLNPLVTVRFSERMKSATINSTKLYITKRSSGVSVTSLVSYEATIETASILPLTTLSDGVTYDVYVSREVRDASGNAMGTTYTWSFVTEQQVERPIISPHAASYECNSLPITIECATPGVLIYYTTDESTPTTLSTPYTAPFVIDRSLTVKAIAVKSGWIDSLVRSMAYDLYWWQALSNGCDGVVSAIETDNSNNVYIAGAFSSAGVSGTNRVAKWNGSSWSAMGTGVDGISSGTTLLFDADKTNLYLGGDFTSVSLVLANRIAKWNGTNWEAISSQIANNSVQCLAFDTATNDLYVGGSFTDAGIVGSADKYLLKNQGLAWTDFGANLLNNIVYSLFFDNESDCLYASGMFTTAGGLPMSKISKWNGTAWSALGSGLSSSAGSLIYRDHVLYAGGGFSDAGGVASADYVAKYNGSDWSALDSGSVKISPEATACVTALKFDNSGVLYIGGSFSSCEGLANASRIVRWNSNTGTWSAMGTGLNNWVFAINVDSLGNVYVGGNFTDAGGIANADYIAKWGKKY